MCVTMTDANGCVATACGTLDPNGNTCNVWISQDSVGIPNGVQLTANPTGEAPFTYIWSTGELTEAIIVSQPGVYCVTITDNSGCTATSCTTIDDDNNPNCSVVIEPTPMGALIAVAGGTAPFTYAWSTNEATESIIPTTSGNYCVTITDANGCEATDCYYFNSGGRVMTPLVLLPFLRSKAAGACKLQVMELHLLPLFGIMAILVLLFVQITQMAEPIV